MQYIDPTCRKDINMVKIHKNNSIYHELAKAKVCYYLASQNRKYITEARISSGRIDVFDITWSIAYEITYTEKESISKKEYPVEIRYIDANLVLEIDFDKLYTLLN